MIACFLMCVQQRFHSELIRAFAVHILMSMDPYPYKQESVTARMISNKLIKILAV